MPMFIGAQTGFAAKMSFFSRKKPFFCVAKRFFLEF